MNYFSKIVMIKYVCGHKKLGTDTYQPFVTRNNVKCPKCNKEGERKNSPCGEYFTCEECGDRQACDIYYEEKGFRLLEERYEEAWKEHNFAKREAQ